MSCCLPAPEPSEARVSDLSISIHFREEQRATIDAIFSKYLEELINGNVPLEHVACFQHLVSWNYARATYTSFRELAKIHMRLTEACPNG